MNQEDNVNWENDIWTRDIEGDMNQEYNVNWKMILGLGI